MKPALAALLVLAAASPVLAQQQPEPPALSPAELEELQRALEADARAAPSPSARPAPAAAPQLPPGALQSMNPDISVVLDVAAAAFSQEPTLQTGGHDPARSGFNLQQLELSLNKSVDPYLRFDSNIVFSLEGVEIEEAYATSLALPARLQVRAGQFLTRFGRMNSTHPHSWDFADQPLALGRVFGSEGNRGLGAEVSWLAPLPWYVEWVGSATSASGEGTTRSFYGGAELTVRSPLDLQATTALKQFFAVTDDLSVLWGLSAANGPNPSAAGAYSQVYGTDLYVKYRPLKDTGWTVMALQAEALYRRRHVPGDVLSDVTAYAQLSYRWSQQWGAALRSEFGTPAVGESGKVAADALDPAWTDVRHRHAAALTFYPTEFSRLRLQGSVDVPRWEDRPRFAAFLALELVVGAHGAHKF